MTNSLALKLHLSKAESKKLQYNHKHWEKNADKFKNDHTVSWGDINLINLEIKNISAFLKDGDLVLDAGCSNGYSTFEIANKKNIRVRAFDYSQKSISYALKSQKTKDKSNRIRFYHGNILNINEPDNSFDKVYTIRVIINLLSWKLQKQAILEMHRVLKPEGLFLLTEGFSGSLKKFNALRKLGGLPPLAMHEFNLYLQEKKFERFVKSYFEIVAIKKFSSVYYVASRFLRYLTMNTTDKDSYINTFNTFFNQFEETDQSGDFGTVKLYVLKKK